MTDQPEFIDNRRGNTLAAAITTYLQGFDSKLAADIEVGVADGFDLSRADLEVVFGDLSEKACSPELRGEIFARMGG